MRGPHSRPRVYVGRQPDSRFPFLISSTLIVFLMLEVLLCCECAVAFCWLPPLAIAKELVSHVLFDSTTIVAVNTNEPSFSETVELH
jgi:hypothetical protein